MTSLMGKTGVYDLLSMVLPGYLVLVLITQIFFRNYEIDCVKLTDVVCVFCVSYVLGITVHYLSRKIFSWLSCRCLREKAYKNFMKDKEARHSKEIDSEDKQTAAWYYNNFYCLWGRSSLSFIQALEIQLTFLRSLVVVGLLYSLTGWLFINKAVAVSLIFVFTIISLLLLVFIQYKIYYYYYEADSYIKK